MQKLKLKSPNKKGQIGGIATSVLSVAVAIIVLVIMLVIIQEIRDTDIVDGGEPGSLQVNETGGAFQSTNNSLVGLGTFGDFVTIIVLAVVAGIVLGIIFGVFGGFGRGTR